MSKPCDLKPVAAESHCRGWTRLCHSDFGSSTSGSTLSWDWPIETVRALAEQATRVRIQTKGEPETAVTSKANTYPILDIRAGQPIGFNRALEEADVPLFWESARAENLKRLWHADGQWIDHGLKVEVCSLESNVYWAACNGGGLHWHGLVDGGHLRPVSTWSNGRDCDLELYIDVQRPCLDSGSFEVDVGNDNELLDVIVHSLAGEEVSHLRVPMSDCIRQVKERIAQTTDMSSYRLRLSHIRAGLLDDVALIQDLPRPLEFQLVRLPLDYDAGAELLEPAFRGDLRSVRRALQNLADPNYIGADAHGHPGQSPTPMILASQGGHLQVVRVLLAAQAELEKRDEDGGITPLLAAASLGSLEIVRFLSEARADNNVQSQDGMTPLHIAAHHGHSEVAEFLCDIRVDVNAQRPAGKTPLHVACVAERLDVVSLLCKFGVELHKMDSDGFTPLMVAAHRGLLPAVKSLCRTRIGKDSVWADGSNAVLLALGQGHLEIPRYLVKVGVASSQARLDDITPLLMSSKVGHFEGVRFFWENGVWLDRESTTEEGHTALHLAAIGGHLRIVHFLCKGGSNVNALDVNGQNPLHLAVVAGHMEVVRLLRDAGSDDSVMLQ